MRPAGLSYHVLGKPESEVAPRSNYASSGLYSLSILESNSASPLKCVCQRYYINPRDQNPRLCVLLSFLVQFRAIIFLRAPLRLCCEGIETCTPKRG